MHTANQYTRVAGDFYVRTPKAVWAALAISLAAMVEERDDVSDERVLARLLDEWRILNLNGIVPQKPA